MYIPTAGDRACKQSFIRLYSSSLEENSDQILSRVFGRFSFVIVGSVVGASKSVCSSSSRVFRVFFMILPVDVTLAGGAKLFKLSSADSAAGVTRFWDLFDFLIAMVNSEMYRRCQAQRCVEDISLRDV